MDIKIYQINRPRDVDRIKFLGLESLRDFRGIQDINSRIYDMVYQGSVEARDLEDVYRIFNVERPKDFKAHSLSVSDVVEVVDGQEPAPGFYFCDCVGFQRVEFNPDLASEPETEEEGMSMELHEAITHASEVSRRDDVCETCRVEHSKLASWLEELYQLKAFLGNKYDIDRLRELVQADREGRIKILPEGDQGTCGTCNHFRRTPGTNSGICDVKRFRKDRYGKEDTSRKFVAQRSTKGCKHWEGRHG